VAEFTAAPTSGTNPLAVQFTDLSTGEIADRAWDFENDGSVDSTEQKPSYTYEIAGTYTVSLIVTGPGGSDTETKLDYVTATYPAPVASFGANPTSGDKPLEVDFTDQSTGEVTSYAWDFGDGNTGIPQTPSHTYQTPGKYTVSLVVTGPSGSDAETKVDYITVTPGLVVTMGQVFELGNYEFVPTSVGFADKVVSGPFINDVYYQFIPTTGYKFAYLEVIVRNKGTEMERPPLPDYLEDHFKAKVNDGDIYDEINAVTALNYLDERYVGDAGIYERGNYPISNVIVFELNPGEEEKVVAIFEILEDTQPVEFYLPLLGLDEEAVIRPVLIPTILAPSIWGVAVYDVTATTATFTWMTNEPATSQVKIMVSPFMYYSIPPLHTDLVRSHSVTIYGLEPNTTYYFKVRSGGASGYVNISGEYIFMTSLSELVIRADAYAQYLRFLNDALGISSSSNPFSEWFIERYYLPTLAGQLDGYLRENPAAESETEANQLGSLYDWAMKYGIPTDEDFMRIVVELFNLPHIWES
jgi:PKD repeat protein